MKIFLKFKRSKAGILFLYKTGSKYVHAHYCAHPKTIKGCDFVCSFDNVTMNKTFKCHSLHWVSILDIAKEMT